MRIAISGSHSLGKSTVVNDWVASRAGYTREEEPYRALGLHGPYEILFRDSLGVAVKLLVGVEIVHLLLVRVRMRHRDRKSVV